MARLAKDLLCHASSSSASSQLLMDFLEESDNDKTSHLVRRSCVSKKSIDSSKPLVKSSNSNKDQPNCRFELQTAPSTQSGISTNESLQDDTTDALTNSIPRFNLVPLEPDQNKTLDKPAYRFEVQSGPSSQSTSNMLQKYNSKSGKHKTPKDSSK